MKKITITKLNKMVEDGDAVINAWASDESDEADVTFYKMRGEFREVVTVTFPKGKKKEEEK